MNERVGRRQSDWVVERREFFLLLRLGGDELSRSLLLMRLTFGRQVTPSQNKRPHPLAPKRQKAPSATVE